MNRLFAAPLALFAMACGTTPAATVTGTIGGAAIPTTSVISGVSSGDCNYANSYGSGLHVSLTNIANACTAISGSASDNTTLLELDVWNEGYAAQPPPIGAGTYSEPTEATDGGVVAFGLFAQTDGAGQLIAAPQYSTSGSVVISSIADGGAVSGSFDLQFGADTVSGTFEAAGCPHSGSAPWCQND